jgi:four helix bundle protein
MKKKTLNAKRRTPSIEWRLREEPAVYAQSKETSSTLNTQRPTPNAQWQKKSRFDLEDRLLDYSARIIQLVDALPNTRAAAHIAGQLLRSGTSPYGNHGEVEAAESRKDFVHKLKICLKELKETRRWVRLAVRSGAVSDSKIVAILNETEELIRIFFSSIRTAERNAK